MKVNELMHVAVKAGEILIKSGAEIYRVEETLRRICSSYGVECEPYVLLSGIFLHAQEENGNPITVIKRIQGNLLHLHRIELVNSFSRDLQRTPLEYAAAIKRLEEIEAVSGFSLPVRLSMAGLTAFVYTLLFSGNALEGAVALILSIFAYYLRVKIAELGFFQFFEYFVAGVIAGAGALAGMKIFPEVNIYKIIIGAIMIFVPGVAITNGIKDALYGDVVSSLYRIAEAVFTATAIGAGVGIALSVGLRFV